MNLFIWVEGCFRQIYLDLYWVSPDVAPHWLLQKWSSLWFQAAVASLGDLTPTRKLKLHIQISNNVCCSVIYTWLALPCNTRDASWWQCYAVHTILQSVWPAHCRQLKLCNRVRRKHKSLPTSFSHENATQPFIANIIIPECCFLFPAALMGLLGVLDFLFVNHACHSIITRGASVQLVFGFEVCQISLEAHKCIASLFLPPGGDGHWQRCCYHIVLSFSFLWFPEKIHSFKQALIWLKKLILKLTLTVWHHVNLMLVKVMGSEFLLVLIQWQCDQKIISITVKVTSHHGLVIGFKVYCDLKKTCWYFPSYDCLQYELLPRKCSNPSGHVQHLEF